MTRAASGDSRMTCRIVPIRQDFLLKTREHGVDDQNQPVVRLTAEGGEPCRDVLRGALPGEELILASYCPFALPGPYKEYGPVFVLAQASEVHVNRTGLPLPEGRATDFLGDTFVLRAYDRKEFIVTACLSDPRRCQQDMDWLFADSRVSFVLVRFAAYGCYGLKLVRNRVGRGT